MKKNDHTRNGSVIVEFALLMAVLLVPLLAGIWDTARLIDMNQVLTRAAREGVVLASRGDDPAPRVLDYVRSEGLSSDNLTVTVQHGPEEPGYGQEVSVTLSYDFTDGMVYPWNGLLPGGLSASAYAKME
ncbi:MAG: pilus assembly protein [Desulfovibrionaceae bacterium]|nr:pilus assembly protein [Desulfovibrionaceae bacterium]